MKSYVLLIKGSFSEWNSLSDEDRKAAIEKFGIFAKSLGAQGYMRGGDGCTERSFRIFSRDDSLEKALLSTSTKDMVTGYFLFQAPDEAEAFKIAKTCPAFDCGEYVELVSCSG